jgi:hypothetical protein
MGRHDGAFHKDVPFPREGIGVTDASRGGEILDIAPDIRQMRDGRLIDDVLPVVELDHGGEE